MTLGRRSRSRIVIDIKIPDEALQDWQEALESLGEIFDGSLFLLSLTATDGLMPQLSLCDDNQVHRQSVAQLCAQGLTLFRDYIEYPKRPREPVNVGGIVLQPLFWPSQALYGALCLVPNEQINHDKRLNTQVKLTCQAMQYTLVNLYQADRQQLAQAEARVDTQGEKRVDLQLFIDSLPEHVWMKDVAGRYVLINKSVELAWGRDREQLLNRTDDEIFSPELAEEFVQGDYESIVRGVQVTAAECEAKDIDQSNSWLETTKVPVVASDGTLEGVIGISRNITSHKAAQEQLELAANIFENSVEGVLITDARGNIVEVHGAFTEITGYSREEVLGENPRILNSGRHDKAFFERLWRSLLTNGKWHGEIWNRRKSGAIYPEQLTISSMYGDDHQVRYFVAVFADISAQKQSEKELARLVYHDPLTKLPNRMMLSANLEQELRHAAREETQLALIFIDVDLFKHINDSYGHVTGDAILMEVARRLGQKLGEEATLARLGSDEFIAVLPHVESDDSVSLMVSRLREAFDAPFLLDEEGSVRLTASMGVAIYPGDGESGDTLLRNADTAMHRAKANGRNNYAFYTQSLTLASVEHLKLQSALHDAISKDAFYLVYQPKLALGTGECVGFEALLRWEDPQLGPISPAIFIPVAENIGLINEIGLWVLKQAATQGAQWLAEGKRFGRISVNVAGPQLQQNQFCAEVKRVLDEAGLPPQYLELEVTESCMMSDPLAVIEVLKQLGELGVELSVDDFGTGYSSLNYLKRLPIHKLKIDQSFIRDIPRDGNNTAIAKAVIALGHALNLCIIAEGVETPEQAAFLEAAGCDQAQGYLYSKPRVVEELAEFLS
ncbi:EAL domain-containing protein [Shewanella sp. JBTF-M18]|uniref:cyclic-guanylate-specific phosphodiesterase n=1 Tax=Shewanella insulae TaxID=2681496 RepID=A0A6L7I256_9GAMM|nr:EAL domain-containing protein [Shewanella insulae]